MFVGLWLCIGIYTGYGFIFFEVAFGLRYIYYVTNFMTVEMYLLPHLSSTHLVVTRFALFVFP